MLQKLKKNQQLEDHFSCMGFNWLKDTEALGGDYYLFTSECPGVPGTHFINLERMKAESNLELLTGSELRAPRLGI